MPIEMKVSGIAMDPVSNMPIVILKDATGEAVVPIWIGLLEASSIAMELEKVRVARPMTHDLMKTVMECLGGKLVKIEVCDLRDNTFYANLTCEKDGKELVIDSRPSDAIAMALRVGCPIYVAENVIKKSRRIEFQETKEEEEGPAEEKWKEILENLPPHHFGKYKM